MKRVVGRRPVAMSTQSAGNTTAVAGIARGLCLVAMLVGCSSNAEKTPDKSTATKSPKRNSLSSGLGGEPEAKRTEVSIDAPRFSDAAPSAGLKFRYSNGARGKWLMVESTGGGAGWIDFDRDGRYDACLVQAGPVDVTPGSAAAANRLFQNESGVRFVDVTTAARIGDTGYGQGITVGDFDNDGFDDIYFTNVGHNGLYRNNGDGTFEDITSQVGVDDKRWSTSAAFGDIDSDGDLDLFVCNYLQFDLKNPRLCQKKDGSPATCHPEQFAGVPNECFENQGDGTFRRIAKTNGLTGNASKSLGVVIADFNGDKRPDIFVANDTTANFLFLNQGNRKFVESASAAGCSMNAGGSFQASMGIAVGDYDRNGHLDLYVTHFTSDSNTLYTGLGRAGFQDTTLKQGLHAPTLRYLAFGTVMSDFNLDGHMDLFVVNGHIDDWRFRGELWHMPDQIFSFDGRRWQEMSQRAGEYFRKKHIGRAVATADYDGDGDLDLLVVQQDVPVTLLKNDSDRGHWLKIELIGSKSNRRGIGTRIVVHQNGQNFVAELVGGSSYCAAHQPVALFGLGKSTDPCDVTLHWPSGVVQKINAVRVDQALVLTEPDKSSPQ